MPEIPFSSGEDTPHPYKGTAFVIIITSLPFLKLLYPPQTVFQLCNLNIAALRQSCSHLRCLCIAYKYYLYLYVIIRFKQYLKITVLQHNCIVAGF